MGHTLLYHPKKAMNVYISGCLGVWLNIVGSSVLRTSLLSQFRGTFGQYCTSVVRLTSSLETPLRMFSIILFGLLLLGLSLLLVQLCQSRLVVPTDMGGQTRVAGRGVNRTVPNI